MIGPPVPELALLPVDHLAPVPHGIDRDPDNDAGVSERARVAGHGAARGFYRRYRYVRCWGTCWGSQDRKRR